MVRAAIDGTEIAITPEMVRCQRGKSVEEILREINHGKTIKITQTRSAIGRLLPRNTKAALPAGCRVAYWPHRERGDTPAVPWYGRRGFPSWLKLR